MNWPASFSYDLAFMPKMVWFAAGSGRLCAVLGACFVAASVLYLLLCLGLSRWSKQPRIRVWGLLLALYLLVTVIVTFSIANLSSALPFPPIYIPIGLAFMVLALLIAHGGYWLRLDPEVRAMVPLLGFVKATTWLALQSYVYIFIPLLIFNMPMFDHQERRIYVLLPILMLLVCLAVLRLILRHLFSLFALEQPVAELPVASREKFLAAREPLLAVAPDCRILVARSGLLNAVALPLTRTIVIGSDLLRCLESAEVRAVLTHELGHLKDRTHLPLIVRNSFLCVFFLCCAYFSSSARLPGEPVTSLLLLLVALYLGGLGNKSLRLEAEAYADRYVHETDAALFPDLISGLEKLNRLNRIDKDFCKKHNYAHLDIDERIAAIEQGNLRGRRRVGMRPALVLMSWMAISFVCVLAFNYFTPGARREWKALHEHYHALLQAGDDPAALQAIKHSLVLAENNFGRNSGSTCTSLNDLTDYYQSHDDLDTAESYATQALAVATATFGAEHARTVRCLTDLGEIRSARGDFAGAVDFYTQVLAIQTHEGSALDERESTLRRLLLLYRQANKVEELARVYQQLIAMCAEAGNDGQSPRLDAELEYIGFLAKEKKYAAADRQLGESQSRAEAVFGRQSKEHADTLLALGKLRKEQKRFPEATTSCQSALEILAGLFGVKSDEYISALAVQADIYRKGGQLAACVATCVKILQVNQERYGSGSAALLGDYWELGLAYEAMGRWGEAAPCFRKVAEIEEAADDTQLESRIETHEKLLVALRALGERAEARRVELKLRGLRKSLTEG